MDEVTLVKTRFRKEQWKQLISDCQSSGMRVDDWCIQNNVSRHAYYYWLRKIREEACELLPVQTENNKPVEFAKLAVTTPVSGTQAAIIVRLPYATVEVNEGTGQQTVEAVLLALKNIC